MKLAFPIEDPKECYFKDKFNYASSSCSALIRSCSEGVSHSSSILNSNEDQYMRMTCGPDICADGSEFLVKKSHRFVVIELCADIKIEHIILWNLECFSSTFKHFSVWISNWYPPKTNTTTNNTLSDCITQTHYKDGWQLIGNFHANNTRRPQIFRVGPMQTFSRYVRVEFHSRYRKEYYCPVTNVRIYGVTMIDEFKEHEYAEKKRKESVNEDVERKTEENTVSPYGEEDVMNMIWSKIVLDREEMHLEKKSARFFSLNQPTYASLYYLNNTVNAAVRRRKQSQNEYSESENIFKTITDKLRHLETNSTLLFRALAGRISALEKKKESRKYHAIESAGRCQTETFTKKLGNLDIFQSMYKHIEDTDKHLELMDDLKEYHKIWRMGIYILFVLVAIQILIILVTTHRYLHASILMRPFGNMLRTFRSLVSRLSDTLRSQLRKSDTNPFLSKDLESCREIFGSEFYPAGLDEPDIIEENKDIQFNNLWCNSKSRQRIKKE